MDPHGGVCGGFHLNDEDKMKPHLMDVAVLRLLQNNAARIKLPRIQGNQPKTDMKQETRYKM